MTALDEYEKAMSIEYVGEGANVSTRLVFKSLADAAIESLKCCGNCGHLDYDGYHHFFQCLAVSPLKKNYPGAVHVGDPCHFTPSRWKERGGG